MAAGTAVARKVDCVANVLVADVTHDWVDGRLHLRCAGSNWVPVRYCRTCGLIALTPDAIEKVEA
jgi:hypothetical protein